MAADDWESLSGWGSSSAGYTITTDGTSYGDNYYWINPEPYDYSEPSEPKKWVTINSDGDIGIEGFHTEKEKLLEEILMKLMNEIIFRKYKVSNDLKIEISSILQKIDKIENTDDDGFIGKEEMLI